MKAMLYTKLKNYDVYSGNIKAMRIFYWFKLRIQNPGSGEYPVSGLFNLKYARHIDILKC